jgi:hypothetical protein
MAHPELIEQELVAAEAAVKIDNEGTAASAHRGRSPSPAKAGRRVIRSRRSPTRWRTFAASKKTILFDARLIIACVTPT